MASVLKGSYSFGKGFLKMPLHRNIFIVTGTLTITYMMLKLIRSISNKSSERASQSKESDRTIEQLDGSIVESNEDTSISNVKPEKRKQDDIAGAMKLPKLKPNYFIAFPVNNIGIHKKVKALQEKIIQKNPPLLPAVIQISTLHITLAVTYLAGEEDVNIVKNKLNAWAADNLKIYFQKPCILNFRGVKTFSDVVAYVDIEKCENYKTITDISENINNILSSEGYFTDKRSFTPHLTILKLSKSYKLLKLKKKFKDEFKLLKECNEHFGAQEVSCVQLLSINEPKTETGYYECAHEIKILNSNEPKMDHSECCAPLKAPKKSVKN